MTISVKEFLKKQVEEMPKWLENYKKGDKININEVLSSRVVYYPGSGSDGQPIKTFNNAEYAHVFVYADYGVSEEEMRSALSGFNYYDLYDCISLNRRDLTPHGWMPHISQSEVPSIEELKEKTNFKNAFAYLAILDRKEYITEEEAGSDRCAILFIGGDAFATYDALFINKGIVPEVVILDDVDDYSTNYDKFGKGGLLEKLAHIQKRMPNFVMCGNGTEVWDGYEIIDNVAPQRNSHGHEQHIIDRYLYKINK